MTMPLNCPGDTPRRSIRSMASCKPKPQSIITSDWRVATSSALPSLPLPSDANRKAIDGRQLLIDVFVNRLDHLFGYRTAGTLLIGDRHLAQCTAIFDIHAVLVFGILAAFPELQCIQPAALDFYRAQEVDALFTVPVLHRQTRALNSQPDFAPRPV